MLESLRDVKGFDEPAFVEVHESGRQVVSIRFNPFKNAAHVSPAPVFASVPWASEGVFLTERPSFTADPLLHAGAYYVQEASSMFLEQALLQTVNMSGALRVLDLCAAPGGKSTHIQSLINENSLLVSNEIIKQRVNVLNENLVKWGGANTIVTNNDP
ncbi:MAG: Fmu (Sun) domain protein, partial [Gemmatimonadaceae bacterium]|nr:Fmu (Sun) domain protein [Chitinophagaceae bacterium]